MADNFGKNKTSLKTEDFFWTEVSLGVKTAEYAVRGIVPSTALQIKKKIENKTEEFPFKEVTFCNIGNPQQFNQRPITFNRQVLACLLDPSLINLPGINPDAALRAQGYLQQIKSVGSYTHSLGIPLVRKNVSKFIAHEDGVEEPSIDNIFLSEGASHGVHMIISSIITNENDAIMIPIPQYPLYSAEISLFSGHIVPYYLNEEKGWQLDIEELERAFEEAIKQGRNVKCIVVINPGNPTGAIFTQQTIQKIIRFSVDKRLVVIADQVYRQNVYKQGIKFVSFRKVLEGMEQKFKRKCELASLHSVSKGLLGQCGLRGGYLYLHNFNPAVYQQLTKLKSISLCSNSIGQIMMGLMCDPPLDGVSKQTKELYQQQTSKLFQSLKKRAKQVTQALKSMKNITTNEVEGSMYAFPKIQFSPKVLKAAGDQAPDLFYCMEVLKNTGIALVPGSGFKQKPGTYHFRITTLILPEEKLVEKLESLKKFNEQFHKKYE